MFEPTKPAFPRRCAALRTPACIQYVWGRLQCCVSACGVETRKITVYQYLSMFNVDDFIYTYFMYFLIMQLYQKSREGANLLP